ncbi:hypothetical protein AB1K83_05485 [Sporosarcina sp. 179-K 3D1 HS]|uniref:hypothetical protein n=1 Tax=Sporosarcina sp. 179-K 3D1 HS TaxID=3232169 RepID=UPI0039A2B813
MTIFKNKHFTGVLSVVVLALFALSFLTHSYSYFHTKEINLLSTRCYENDGKVLLEIHNNLTGAYSFECQE